ncbi:hypothetical protein SDRG_01576 [Saprolegnia diclina VS20]|uniref:RNA-dependent RNA polymerase n=1 Tax=Saprolegnia diclina (strain VS20) TaxID=1156394 RepID=T0SFA8_SAPDV|nr:hypothetical protein SDRG_01576 [Saprolegnia diclina VS20]EQC41617.1 hypothetical protein SDRG_01576 [Saprolegnia diclina VS20]|eukprot:XP_008605331.1 hypothetical protein SDRG_01576 [Saprolegnia diclina VS20]
MSPKLVDFLEALEVAREAKATRDEMAKAAKEYIVDADSMPPQTFAAALQHIPFKMSAYDVVELCKRAGVTDIKQCIITTPYRASPFNTTAIVSVRSRAAHDQLLQLHKTPCQGRTLKVRDYKTSRTVSGELSQRFDGVSLHVVPSRDCFDTVPPRFSAAQAVTLVCTVHPKVAFAIEFQTTYRAAFSSLDVAAVSVGSDDRGFCVVWFELHQPPLMYESAPPRAVAATSFLEQRQRERTQWPSSATPIVEWTRCVDPSPSKAFGAYRNYQVTLREVFPEEMHALLQRLGLERVLLASGQQRRLTPALEGYARPDSDWSGGYDHMFAGLSYARRYALHVLVSHHAIVFTHARQVQKLVAAMHASDISADALLRLVQWKSRRSLTWHKLLESLAHPPEAPFADPPGYVRVQRVRITPLRILVDAPDVDVSNRVLRLYPHAVDRFVRVTFVDEDFASVHSVKTAPSIFGRIKQCISNGFFIAGEHVVFLGYSSAQLRSHSCWFYRVPTSFSDDAPTLAEIYTCLGDFGAMPTAGKRGARLGQAFSGTTVALRVPRSQCVELADVNRKGFCFSDGVGTISPALANVVADALHWPHKVVADKLGCGYKPSAFQIRYGGYKGVVAVDPQLKEAALGLRPSMRKFETDLDDLEICRPAFASPCYLNRQLINVLSSRGVPDEVFLQLTNTMLQALDTCLNSTDEARAFVFRHDPHSLAATLLAAGATLEDRHVFEYVDAIRRRRLLDVQTKARIYVECGVMLMGVLDETGTLPPDCVFFQTSGKQPPPHATLAVGRCPCLHPGDIRRLTYVHVPALSHLHDVVVFSAHGDRPTPDTMAGGDLDGDIYFCIWNQKLVPPTEFAPMTKPPSPLPPRITTPSMEVVGAFYLEYLRNDNLGTIANLHMVLCDRSVDGAADAIAIEMATAHAIAVDYAKTGEPACIPPHPPLDAYPDFLEKADKPSYRSTSVLGLLYQATCGVRPQPPPYRDFSIDARFLAPGYERYLDDAQANFIDFSVAFHDIATRFDVDSEMELVTGYARRKRSADVAERLTLAVNHVLDGFAATFWADFAADVPRDAVPVLQKASAWYFRAYSYRWPHGKPSYLSFAWVAIEPMCLLLARRTIALE